MCPENRMRYNNHTQANDIIASGLDPMVYLYTGHQAIRPFAMDPLSLFYFKDSPPMSKEELFCFLRAYQPKYLIETPMPLFSEEKPFSDLLLKISKEYPGWVNPVSVGKDKRFIIYEIKYKPGMMENMKKPLADDQAINQSGRQGFLSCPKMVCPCRLHFSSESPLSISAGLGFLRSTALRYRDSKGQACQDSCKDYADLLKNSWNFVPSNPPGHDSATKGGNLSGLNSKEGSPKTIF